MLRRTKRVIVVTGLLSAIATVAFAQDADPAFRVDVVKLMELTGAKQLGQQISSAVSKQILDLSKRKNPNVSPRAIEIAQDVLDAELAKAFDGPDGFISQLVPIYARYFTHEDIRGMIAFYESDLGRKIVSTMPALMQDSLALGAKWGAAITPRLESTLQERWKAEGIIK